MPTKKQYLAEVQGEWAAGRIRVTYKRGIKPHLPLGNSTAAYELIYSLWDKELITLQEQCMAVFLNHKGQVIGYRLLNTGTMSQCDIDIRLLISLALHCMASSVILAHNHPSGVLEPSERDKELTNEIKQALTLIKVTLQDHLIITTDRWLSFLWEDLL